MTSARGRYVDVGRLFVRALAVIYLIAFASLAVQIQGLYGSRGILPVNDYLAALRQALGPTAWREVPTLLWLRHDDVALVATCWLGAGSAVALAAGVLVPFSAGLCWLLYCSLFQVGRVFLGFQWDALLLESGFLAIFLFPLRPPRLRAKTRVAPRPTVVWLLRWLLFRLMFSSGMVKLLSHDPAWRDLTALQYHYWTQPLPTWTSWYAHLLPPTVDRSCAAVMFFIELVVPLALAGPRRLRVAAFAPLVLLQVLIGSTGNYAFFNLLTVTLCLFTLDDAALARVAPWCVHDDRGAAPRQESACGAEARRAARGSPTFVGAGGRAAGYAIAALLACAGGAAMMARLAGPRSLPRAAVGLLGVIEPYHVVGSYGLFAVMTRERPEIVLEGSADGVHWREYAFRWKPGDVMRRPAFVEPYQPRLDWQMWFAALGDRRRGGWLEALEWRLLEGSAPVLALLGDDPFAGAPPRFVRAMLYRYEFTDAATRSATGAWWTRSLVGQAMPTLAR